MGGRHPILFALLALDVGLVSLQYILGMYVNLFVQIPFGAGGGGMMGMGWMTKQPALLFHMMNGMAIFLLTLLTAVASLFSRETRLAMASWAGFVSVSVAGAGGIGFLMSRGSNSFSYLMALSALGALLSLSMAFILAWGAAPVREVSPSSPPGRSREYLDMRYARGEIGREEYLRVKQDLNPSQGHVPIPR